MLALLARWRTRRKQRSLGGRRPPRSRQIESLEDRRLLAFSVGDFWTKDIDFQFPQSATGLTVGVDGSLHTSFIVQDGINQHQILGRWLNGQLIDTDLLLPQLFFSANSHTLSNGTILVVRSEGQVQFYNPNTGTVGTLFNAKLLPFSQTQLYDVHAAAYRPFLTVNHTSAFFHDIAAHETEDYLDIFLTGGEGASLPFVMRVRLNALGLDFAELILTSSVERTGGEGSRGVGVRGDGVLLTTLPVNEIGPFDGPDVAVTFREQGGQREIGFPLGRGAVNMIASRQIVGDDHGNFFIATQNGIGSFACGGNGPVLLQADHGRATCIPTAAFGANIDSLAVNPASTRIYVAARSVWSTSLALFPEILISGNGFTIPDGAAQTHPLNNTEFGFVDVGTAVVREFVLRSNGHKRLDLTGSPRLTFDDAHGDFTLLDPLPASLAAGETFTVRVEFRPSAVGLRESTVRIAHNGVGDGEYSFTLEGTGIAVAAPDLTPWTPAGWPAPLVISTTPGTHTDAAVITSADRLYVDWSHRNVGAAATNARFDTRLVLNGSPVSPQWFDDPPFAAGASGEVVDVELGPLPPGLHTLRLEVDYLNNVAESDETNNVYEKQFEVVAATVDLAPWTPPGWPAPLVLSTEPGTNEEAGVFTTTDTIYLDWAQHNAGNVPVAEPFAIRLLLNGQTHAQWTQSPPLAPGPGVFVEDVNLGSLPPGVHTVRLELDFNQAIDESDETNNVVERQFVVVGSQVVGRRVFYNHSPFDGDDPAAGPADDNAVAPTVEPLSPGQTASAANISSYVRGLNGLMIDVADLPVSPAIDAADFSFRVGNSSDPSTWSPPAAEPSISVRRGAGVGGADRVTLIWPDRTILGQWLEVTLRATPRTGLRADDVFYFGSAPGDTGDGDPAVNAVDFIAARDNPRTFLNPATIADPYDFNRDGLVNAVDLIIVRDHATTAENALQLISPPAAPAGELLAEGESATEILPLRSPSASTDGAANSLVERCWEVVATDEEPPRYDRAVDLLMASLAGSAPSLAEPAAPLTRAAKDGQSADELLAALPGDG